jgi:hypothetical protein
MGGQAKVIIGSAHHQSPALKNGNIPFIPAQGNKIRVVAFLYSLFDFCVFVAFRKNIHKSTS